MLMRTDEVLSNAIRTVAPTILRLDDHAGSLCGHCKWAHLKSAVQRRTKPLAQTAAKAPTQSTSRLCPMLAKAHMLVRQALIGIACRSAWQSSLQDERNMPWLNYPMPLSAAWIATWFSIYVLPSQTQPSGPAPPTTLECMRDNDGRFLAGVVLELPGARALGATAEDAMAKAQAVALRAFWPSGLEQGEVTPRAIRIELHRTRVMTVDAPATPT